MRDERTVRLTAFFDQWRTTTRATSQVGRLSRFLDAFAAVRPPAPVPRKTVAVDLGRLRQFLKLVKEPLKGQRVSGAALNPWTVAGLRRYEVRNAAVLASLWSPRVAGVPGTEFLDTFLRHLRDPAKQLPSAAELKAGYVIRTEHCPVGDGSDRIDLTIEGQCFVLGIEIKITAPLRTEQLERYARSLAAWGRGRKRSALVFLAPYSPQSGLSDAIPATWRDVAAAGRRVLPRADQALNHQQFLLDMFVRHIGTFGA